MRAKEKKSKSYINCYNTTPKTFILSLSLEEPSWYLQKLEKAVWPYLIISRAVIVTKTRKV